MNKTPEQLAKEAQLRYQREWREKNHEKVTAYHKEWRKANPDKVKANMQRYWLRKAEQYAASDTENKTAH